MEISQYFFILFSLVSYTTWPRYLTQSFVRGCATLFSDTTLLYPRKALHSNKALGNKALGQISKSKKNLIFPIFFSFFVNFSFIFKLILYLGEGHSNQIYILLSSFCIIPIEKWCSTLNDSRTHYDLIILQETIKS